MERRGKDISLAQRILAAKAPVVVVRGPAGSGKTTAAMAVYQHYLDPRTGEPACLLLGPNYPAVRYMRGLITAAAPGRVAVSPAAMTFASLANRVLLDCGVEARPASAFERRLLLARIVDDLSASGALAAFPAVADTPGLVLALDRAIAEIKRAAIEPDDLDRAVGNPADRRGDLAAVYRQYQKELAGRKLHDVEGQAWLALEELHKAMDGSTRVQNGHAAAPAPLPGLTGVRAIVADGFTDFTPTQLAILNAASSRLERVVITLPHAEDPRRRMWHWTDRTLNNIRRRFGNRLAEIETERLHAEATENAERTGESAPSRRLCFGRLWDSVFDIDATCDPPDGLSIIAAAGMESEVAAVARRVKRLLVGGTRTGRIGVLARSLETYAPTIRRVFADHDIPLAPKPEPLTEVPVIRFAMGVASLSPEWAWNDVLSVLRSSYFRPGSLGEFDERTVAAAEKLIREGNVQTGRDAYAQAAQRFAARAERDHAARVDEEDHRAADRPLHEPTALEYRQAGEMLDRLFDLAGRASEPDGLTEIVAELDLPAAACDLGEPELIARDLRALATLEDHLARLPEPAPSADNVLRALTAVTCPAGRGESLIDVLDVLDARAIRYDHVFVLGVSERMFPSAPGENPLVGESDRAAWRRRGAVLDSRSDLTAREMLLFYLAISRADTSLTLSYLEADGGGQVGSPSSFLLALGSAVGSLDALPTERIAPGPHIPEDASIATARDALCAGLAGLLETNQPPAPGALSWCSATAPEALLHAARGIYAAHRRWIPGECTEFDGHITDNALRAELKRRYTRRPVFSAAQLDTFGQCPWQFFAKYVLRLSPPVEPHRRLEPTFRGTFCHNVLFRLMRSLTRQAHGPVRLADVPDEQITAGLDAAVAAEADAVEARTPPYPVLWQIQLDQMRRDLQTYLDAARASKLPAAAMRFELSFGSPLAGDELCDELSTDQPVAVKTPAGEIRIRGRLDRVDRLSFEGAGGLLVVDYKTGRLPGEKDMLEGRNLQMPLYAAAVESLLGERCVGGAFHGIGGSGKFERFFAAVTTGRGKKPYKLDENYENKLEIAMGTVGRFINMMAEGRFDVMPTGPCPSYCPMRHVCQYSPVRAQRKTPPGLAEAQDNGEDR